MIKNILITGDSRLLEVSTEVANHEFNTKNLDNLITDMLDTMRHNNGVGIAAIQIGIPKRVLLIEYNDANPRYHNTGNCPLTVVINPKIEIVGMDTDECDEGCLSVPGIRDKVTRPKHLRYSFYDATGKLINGESDGFFARVLQHEVDHLDGILLPMRISSKYIQTL